MDEIREGKASVIQNKGVFYNPKMKELRDISVLFLRALNLKDAYLLDSTSATGIRGIRYAKEARIKKVLFLDMNRHAAKNTRLNLRRNRIKAEVVTKSVQEFSNTYKKPFDVIDLDPFGSPASCLYDLLKLSKDETILMVTATDTAVLCGAHSAACLKTYGSKPLHNELCKEVGLRILVNFILRNAAQFNSGIEVLLSISDMHYMRVFLKLKKGAENADKSIAKSGSGTFCNNCKVFHLESGIAPALIKNCEKCDNKVERFGPLYLGNLYDKKLVKNIIKLDSSHKIMNLIYNEYDTQLFYSIPKVTQRLRVSAISPQILRDKLRKKGFAATRTQFDKDGIKTSAGISEITSIVKSIKA